MSIVRTQEPHINTRLNIRRKLHTEQRGLSRILTRSSDLWDAMDFEDEESEFEFGLQCQ